MVWLTSKRLVWSVAAAMILPWLVAADQNDAAPVLPKNWQTLYAEFLRLPEDVRQHLLRIDRQLQEEDSETRARLIQVLKRYGQWRDRLTPEQRQWIDAAATDAERIARIRRVREEQWIANLPKVDRDRIAEAAKRSPEERQRIVETIRREQAERKRKWFPALARALSQEQLARIEFPHWRERVLNQLEPKERERIARELSRLRPWQAFERLRQLAEEKGVPIPPPLQGRQFAAAMLPPVSARKLVHFLDSGVERAERDRLVRRLLDPRQRDRALAELKVLYWRAHPEELRRVTQEDARKRHRGRFFRRRGFPNATKGRDQGKSRRPTAPRDGSGSPEEKANRGRDSS